MVCDYDTIFSLKKQLILSAPPCMLFLKVSAASKEKTALSQRNANATKK